MQEEKKESRHPKEFDPFYNNITFVMVFISWFAGMYLLFGASRNSYGNVDVVNLIGASLSILIFLYLTVLICLKKLALILIQYFDLRFSQLAEYIVENVSYNYELESIANKVETRLKDENLEIQNFEETEVTEGEKHDGNDN